MNTDTRLAIATDRGRVAAHFGRCPAYTLVDIRNGEVTGREEIENPGHEPGFLPRYLAKKGARFVIAGGMGPRARDLFTANGIETLVGVQGTIDEVVACFLSGELEAGESLCDHGHGHGAGDHACGGHGAEEPSLPASGQGGPAVTGPAAGESAGGRRIAVTATGPSAGAETDPRFGRAAWFLLFDPVTLDSEAVENTAAAESHGAGIAAARLLAGRDVGTILTGECGPQAAAVLQAAGIRVVTGTAGPADEAVRRFLSGRRS